MSELKERIEYGDLVKIKTWDEMLVDGFEEISEGLYSLQEDFFHKKMKDLCGKTFIVKLKGNINYSTVLRIMSNNTKKTWKIYACFVKIVEKGYLQRIKQNSMVKAINKNIDDNIIKEMISKVDIMKVKKAIAGATNTKLENIKAIDKLLIQWAEAKKDIYLLLDNNLSITNEITLDLEDRAVIHSKLNEIQNKFPQYYPIFRNINIDDIINNKISYMSCYTDSFNNKIENMKLTKFISTYFNDKNLNMEFSKFYQDKIITNLTISINPIDYLLMSKNSSGWKSCHDIAHDNGERGCYAGGTLSYMCDSSTLIAFTHSNELVKIDIKKYTIKDYSKNWRQCVYYDKENRSIVFSRQYPNFSVAKCKYTREILEDLISKHFNVHNKWKLIKDDYMGRYVQNAEGALNYNDCDEYQLSKSEPNCYYMVYNEELTTDKRGISIEIGSSPICPICGEENVIENNHLGCSTCDDDFERE